MVLCADASLSPQLFGGEQSNPAPVPMQELTAHLEALSSPRRKIMPFHLSPLPQLSPPVSPRMLPSDLALRQIGDGSFIPIANGSFASDTEPVFLLPLRSPLRGGEAQRAVLRQRKVAVERFESTRRDLWNEDMEKTRLAKMAREAREVAAAAEREKEAEQRRLYERVLAEREAIMKQDARERRRLKRLEKRLEHEALYGKKGSGTVIEKNPYAFLPSA